MNDQSREERFDLARFVLDYMEHKGSIVTPPAFGISEVLLPDELADALQIEPYLSLRFDSTLR